MVRGVSILILALCIQLTGFCQHLHIGADIGIPVNVSLKTHGGRNYYLNIFDGSQNMGGSTLFMPLSGKTKAYGFLYPEFFVRYENKNRWFVKTSLNLQHYTVDLKLDQDIMTDLGHSEYMYDIRFKSGYTNLNLQAGYFILTKSLVKPYLSAGICSQFLTYYTFYKEKYNDNIILQDLDRLSQVTLSGRAAIGIKFYDLHLEYNFQQNISSLDNTDQPFYKTLSASYIMFGYDFLVFNTVKKKREQ